jgi:signal transduction histidine kinase
MDLASLDPDIQARVRPAAHQTDHTTLITNLGPEFPYSELVVALSDPKELALRKDRLRTMRFAIVLLALALTGLGVLLSIRMVSRQIETARTKADFAANVSHELRSPITQIRLKGEALQLGLCTDEKDRQQHYDAIVRESERLSRLVDNVLDFSAIERGTKSYIFRPEDICSLLRTTVGALQGSFESENATIAFDLPLNVAVVWIDREAISQVILNLVSNALKYGGEEKWVSVSAQQTRDGVQISISDRGIGISADELKHIFDNFYRSTNAKVRQQKGTGIGLTIAAYIVGAHGGSISVKSKLGEGTTFSIHLPLEAPKGSGA